VKKAPLSILLSMALSLGGYAQVNLFNGAYEISSPPDFSNRRPLSGSPYLFENKWVRAEVISSDNKFLRNDSILYNFDKASQTLFLTLDRDKVVEVDKREYKSVTFYSYNSAYAFEHVYPINNKDLFQVLIKSPDKYSLYKLTSTSLKDDEYIDTFVYYILFPDKRFVRLHSPKIKFITRAFILREDSQKVEAYCSLHANETSNENYLKDLIKYLNE